MKININDIRFSPSHLNFSLSVYGQPTEKIQMWIKYWNLEFIELDSYTNIFLPENFIIENAFYGFEQYDFIDGFSPNLNKHLHVGHLSNFVYAKAFQKLQIGKKFIAVFGDTLNGSVDKNNALEKYNEYIRDFDYKIDNQFFASEVSLIDDSILKDGTDNYVNTKIIEIEESKIVAIKSDGSTSYFYQDVAVAQKLNSSTLYLTGLEQNNHFATLKKLFPHISHVGLGLVMLNGKKMSSSEGNIIYMDELMSSLLKLFNDDKYLVWNILAAIVLKNDPEILKNINTSVITNPKLSSGLYISYTMAKMNSAGIELMPSVKYESFELELKSLRAKVNLKPNILLDAILLMCKKINKLYETHMIRDNPTNHIIFQKLTSDLIKATDEIGLFRITKV